MDFRLKAYLAQAIYDYCIHHRKDPHVVVATGGSSKLPAGHSENGQVTFNLGSSAIRDFQIDEEWMIFSARFASEIHVVSINLEEVIWMGIPNSHEGISFMIQVSESEKNKNLSDAAESNGSSEMAQGRQIGNRKLKLL